MSNPVCDLTFFEVPTCFVVNSMESPPSSESLVTLAMASDTLGFRLLLPTLISLSFSWGQIQ